MEAVCNCRHDYLSHEPSTKHAIQATQTRVAAFSSSRSLDINLVTEEGDKVTLSMEARASAIHAAHGAAGMDENEMYARWGELGGGQFERDITLTVEGDLSTQERREIRNVMGTINRMMNRFVQGKLSPMMDKVQKLQGLETIDSLEVEMSYENQLLVAQQRRTDVSYDHNGEVTPLKALAGGPPAEAPTRTEARSVAEKMAEAVNTSKAPKDPVRTMVDRMLQAYRDQAFQRDPLEGHIMDHIREIFEAALEAFRQGGDDADDEARSVDDAH